MTPGEAIGVLGSTEVTVEHNQQVATLPLVVTDEGYRTMSTWPELAEPHDMIELANILRQDWSHVTDST